MGPLYQKIKTATEACALSILIGTRLPDLFRWAAQNAAHKPSINANPYYPTKGNLRAYRLNNSPANMK